MGESETNPTSAVGQVYAKVLECYGTGVFRTLCPSVEAAEGKGAGFTVAVNNGRHEDKGADESVPDDEAERLILAALLVLLHENGGGYAVSFPLRDLLRLLGWSDAESAWGVLERTLERGMQPVCREVSVVSRAASGDGRQVRVTSWRKLIAGYEYSQESARGAPEPLDLAGRLITVTLNPDFLPGLRDAGPPP